MSAELQDEVVNKATWMIPNALALVGSRSGDERNGMTTSWITQLSMEPVLIGIGVDNKAVTHRLITDGGSFTVNLWSSEDTGRSSSSPNPLPTRMGRSTAAG